MSQNNPTFVLKWEDKLETKIAMLEDGLDNGNLRLVTTGLKHVAYLFRQRAKENANYDTMADGFMHYAQTVDKFEELSKSDQEQLKRDILVDITALRLFVL